MSHNHSHSSAGKAASSGHDDGHDGHDLQKSVRKYIGVFVALLIGTVITVLVSYHRFPNHGTNIAVAMAIASLKVFLVAGFFMHLLAERKLIYSVLVVTVFFFISLMYITVWSMAPDNLIHQIK
jgi:cytochrome c oxidase subunit 4